jgi:predicted phosphodiesterase
MRVAVVSDVHANLHALEAVLAAVERARPDAVWCLGDVVGYGPQPSSCCSLTERHATLGLVGNHDLGAIGRLGLHDFSPEAADAARWTAGALTAEARSYLEGLQPTAVTEHAALYHASPREPVWEYVLGPESAQAALADAPRPLVLVGHTHVAMAVGLRETIEGGLAPEGTDIDLGSAERWLLNPGSVGQPRDGDPRAAWLLLDLDAGRAEFRRCSYPVERTQQEIRAAGLPEQLAERLAEGV